MDQPQMIVMAMLFVAGLWAGVQNALAGGGSFITLPALIFAGLSPIGANVTSTVALFPGQVAMGVSGRRQATGTQDISLAALMIISLLGGAAGALLLLATPERLFAALVPWLVLSATAVFAWGNFFRDPARQQIALGRWGAYSAQAVIAVYGGYFGGGIGILMLAALTMAGMAVRTAGATKNVLAAIMNASAVAMFVASPLVDWRMGVPLAIGAVIGGLLGASMLKRVNERWLKVAVVAIGVALSAGLFLKPVG